MPPGSRRMKVSAYDRTSALLVSLLILVGAAVLMLFIVWVTGRVFIKPKAVAPQLVEPPQGGNAMGSSRDLAEPGDVELEDLAEPELEATLDALTDVISTELATLDALGGDAAASTEGGGAGDSRLPGPGTVDNDTIPRWERWEILFSASNLNVYARQLDFFGIELAAVGGGRATIDYAAGFSGQRARTRVGQGQDENRMYMTWRYGPLRQADYTLLKRAGIDPDGRVVMQFFPPEVESRLTQLEADYAASKQRGLSDIQTTIFAVVGTTDGYKFEIKEQTLRIGS